MIFPLTEILLAAQLKGYPCPLCGENTLAYWLKHSKKMCYDNHIRFLPANYPY